MYLSSNIIVHKKENKKKSEKKSLFQWRAIFMTPFIFFNWSTSCNTYLTLPGFPQNYRSTIPLHFQVLRDIFEKFSDLNIRIICIIELCIDAITVAFSCISYRNQLFDFLCKSNDWFLYQMQHWAEIGYSNVFN